MMRLQIALALAALSFCGTALAAPIPCQRLKGHVVFTDRVHIVSSVPANSFNNIPLPPFCRVIAVANPTPTSVVNIEVWLPSSGNGRFEQVGNNGFAGEINYLGLMIGLLHGYATASTDDGSKSNPPATFALDPNRLDDFAFRAVKLTTDAAKTIFQAASGQPPKRSYFHGCSEGGREALMAAQRHPSDFDGIIVGAPANFWTHQFISFAWNAQQVYSDKDHPFTPVLPESALKVLSDASLKQCRGKDGGVKTDAYLTDPRKCKVDLDAIACADDTSPVKCLTAKQRGIVKAIYGGPTVSGGKQIFPGLQPGNENHKCNWAQWITGQAPTSEPCAPPIPTQTFSMQGVFAVQFFENFMAGQNVHVNTFDFDGDTHKTDTLLAQRMNATDPDLTAFRSHGGKIIQYHGWSDAAVAPENSINYYTAVQKKMGGADDFYRLFMVPGMAHCAGGEGPNTFGNIFDSVDDADHSVLRALERWVEQGKAPEKIIATKYLKDVPTVLDAASIFVADRPLCPYPMIAKLVGSDPNSASQFKCAKP